ncbi:MAG: hypothetical protein EPN91_08800 [Salinibacterium sp.]|nr:MAG: hypothetical protein EPN91_08800 [Salinibacterium sp.]
MSGVNAETKRFRAALHARGFTKGRANRYSVRRVGHSFEILSKGAGGAVVMVAKQAVVERALDELARTVASIHFNPPAKTCNKDGKTCSFPTCMPCDEVRDGLVLVGEQPEQPLTQKKREQLLKPLRYAANPRAVFEAAIDAEREALVHVENKTLDAAVTRLKKVVDRNSGLTNLMGVRVLDLHHLLRAYETKSGRVFRGTIARLLGFHESDVTDVQLLKAIAAREKEREAMREFYVEGPPAFLLKRTGKPPIAQHLKDAGGVLDRIATARKAAGDRYENHYALNQIAHWLWRLSGAEKDP